MLRARTTLTSYLASWADLDVSSVILALALPRAAAKLSRALSASLLPVAATWPRESQNRSRTAPRRAKTPKRLSRGTHSTSYSNSPYRAKTKHSKDSDRRTYRLLIEGNNSPYLSRSVSVINRNGFGALSCHHPAILLEELVESLPGNSLATPTPKKQQQRQKISTSLHYTTLHYITLLCVTLPPTFRSELRPSTSR